MTRLSSLVLDLKTSSNFGGNATSGNYARLNHQAVRGFFLIDNSQPWDM